MTRCEQLVFGYSPCTRPAGHTGPHYGDINPRRTP